MSVIADVQLGANNVARRVFVLSTDTFKKLELNMDRREWFSVMTLACCFCRCKVFNITPAENNKGGGGGDFFFFL